MKVFKNAILVVVFYLGMSSASNAAFWLDVGVNQNGTMYIYYNGDASGITSSFKPTLSSNLQFYDVSDPSYNANSLPVFSLGVAWQTGEFDDLIVSDNLNNANLFYFRDSSYDWGTAQIEISGLIPNHHYLVLIDSSDNLGSWGTFSTSSYANGGSAFESGYYGAVTWGFVN